MLSWILIAGTLVAATPRADAGKSTATSPDSGYVEMAVRFSEAVANIELASSELVRHQPKLVRVPPSPAGFEPWFGRIHRRLPDDPMSATAHDVPFAVTYDGDSPAVLWCDLNLNGDLSDDPPIRLYDYPEPDGARAGLVDLSWSAGTGPEPTPIQRKYRIVSEPRNSDAVPPRYRVHMVFAMVGALEVDGTPRRAFLFDGNCDGIYSDEYGDGFFVDANGDGNIVVDPSVDEFLPFSVPTQVGGTLYQTVLVARTGDTVVLRVREGESPLQPLRLGLPAPDFEFEALDGRTVQLSGYRGHPVVIHFWASWCAACTRLAPRLRSIYNRFHPLGLEVVGISFDRELAATLEFVNQHQEPWPTSHTGRGFWENSIARRYRVAAAGATYLVDSEGKYVGTYADLEQLDRDIPGLLLQPAKPSVVPHGLH